MRILMLGDNLTAYNDLPSILAEFLQAEVESITREDARLFEFRNPSKELGKRTEEALLQSLDQIKEANARSGAFSNCNPVKENWINGYFGIQGFNLCCVGNFDSARVEVYFGKADNDENKKAYDLVAGHKAEVERALGEKLIWDRGDEKKSSKIYYKIDNVGMGNEADWPVIAKYHAKWTVKLYESIVVPYLKPAYLNTLTPVTTESIDS